LLVLLGAHPILHVSRVRVKIRGVTLLVPHMLPRPARGQFCSFV